MLQHTTLKFLKALKQNNNKAWFDANRKNYEAAKTDFIAFVQQLINGISQFDVEVNGLLAKSCIFRINRDIRFSKDKSPYKTNMGAYINPGGKKENTPGYYIHLEPGKSFIAGGLYVPEAAMLAKVRQEIDYNFEAWKSIISNKNFKKYFTTVDGIETLSRPPKGYEANNPAIEYLKMKSFIVSRNFTDEIMVSKTLLKESLNTFNAMKPMIDFLREAIA
ncbi:MAG TPA: DUF2461 domain-containing protein [Ferruginibacter sp.]|nr:DUF2461 domain-containing protein [Ferruginibacter sp.]HMP20661.1 DUF2461 domain-containing protein [Ferruginibacter sp.]